jgi:hypothetical protein
MILSATVLSITTGKSKWLLIFGGASVPLVLGTLIWKPLDKTLYATAISQQIDLIHVQVQAVFTSTLDVTERVRICQEGIQSLQRITSDSALAFQKGRPARGKKGN